LKLALEKVGIQIVDNADIALHYCVPHFFEPLPNYYNVLFSMWESTRIPKEEVKAFNEADCIIVPNKFCKDVFKNSGVYRTIYVCRQGIMNEQYPFVDRWSRWQSSKKRTVLWTAAPNPRKGLESAVYAIYNVRKQIDLDVYFYIKTTRFGDYKEELKYLEKHKTYLDTRLLSRQELFRLYEQADVFLFPLPPLEAMATGLPVIAPSWSGLPSSFRGNGNRTSCHCSFLERTSRFYKAYVCVSS